MKRFALLAAGIASLQFTACQGQEKKGGTSGKVVADGGDTLHLPAPYVTKSVRNFSKVVGWPEGKTPTAPAGFVVKKFADSLNSPRWIYTAPNGDIFIAEARTESKGLRKAGEKVVGYSASKNINDDKSGNKILLLRDTDGDGVADSKTVFLANLNRPFGMLVIGNSFYVANTDGLVQYPYKPGQTSITAAGKKIVDLPAGGYNNHWTRNIITNEKQDKIYISVGSGSNVGENGMEHEVRRANILVVNLDGSNEQVYASGLRNPVGMDWAPGTGTLWTAVNERDNLGDDLVPDYMTSVKEGGFYGWPYSYWGQYPDPRLKGEGKDLVAKAIVPDVNLGSHTASLGLAFNRSDKFPEAYKSGAFIGQHGSWNRSQIVGYKVVFVPFANGKPSGKQQDFLTGFVANADKEEVYGRPVGVAFSKAGYMLVADDAANVIWSVVAQ